MKKIINLIILISLLVLNISAKSVDEFSYDVIIVGAGIGGISAAIEASRLGSRVLLIEETDWVGGQATSAGVTSMDGNYTRRYGIYKEFTDKIILHYQNIGKSSGGCYWNPSTICFEPHVGKNILLEMIENEENIDLHLLTRVLSVDKNINNEIIGVDTTHGYFSTSVLIDATEYGDIIKMSGANYRIGNKTNENYSESACIQNITYTAVIKEYPNGIPQNLKIVSPPPGYNSNIANYFSVMINNNGSSVWNGTYPVNFDTYTKYRLMPNSNSSTPNSKTSVNWFNDFSYNNMNNEPTLPTQFLYDLNYRKEKSCDAKLRTLHFLYYIQNIMGKSWSISTDEGYANSVYNQNNLCENIPNELKDIEKNMPVIPYVRESIRGIGLVTLTGKNIYRTGNPPIPQNRYNSSIALGDYPTDLHACKSNSELESQFEVNSDISGNGVFQIPIETLISENVEGLIFAEKNISVTRIANGATRLQPITMLTGQAAGTLAHFSAQENITPRLVDFKKVQNSLLNNDVVLFPYNDMNLSSSYFVDMQMMSVRGIMSGYNYYTFGSNDNMTREQMAVILSKAFNISPVSPTGIFSDVSVNSIYAPYIEAIYTQNITAGCGTNPLRFCPTNFVPHSQMSVFIYKGWRLIDSNVTLLNPSNPTYSDVPSSYWTYQYFETLANEDIKWYCSGNNMCPNNNMKRSEISYVINQILLLNE